MTETKELSSIVEELRQCSKALGKLADGLSNLSKNETPAVQDDESKKSESKATISLEDVRAVLADLSRQGFTANIKEIIKSFGADKLSDVKQSDYESLLDKAKELI